MTLKGVRAALSALENDWNTGDASTYCTLILEDAALISSDFAYAMVKIHMRQTRRDLLIETTVRVVAVLVCIPGADWSVSRFDPLPS